MFVFEHNTNGVFIIKQQHRYIDIATQTIKRSFCVIQYQSIQAFNYDSVIVRPNINNTQELFIYDEKGVFVDISTRIGFDGVSAESAKMAEKISLKRIKWLRKICKLAGLNRECCK